MLRGWSTAHSVVGVVVAGVHCDVVARRVCGRSVLCRGRVEMVLDSTTAGAGVAASNAAEGVTVPTVADGLVGPTVVSVGRVVVDAATRGLLLARRCGRVLAPAERRYSIAGVLLQLLGVLNVGQLAQLSYVSVGCGELRVFELLLLLDAFYSQFPRFDGKGGQLLLLVYFVPFCGKLLSQVCDGVFPHPLLS